ncbi:MAG: DnaJ domain-containing protein [Pyrinomonadaceae bacterium]|nr:DnaJ domain-containing protein [Pyrinomonadaceae bacterium]MCX7639299.1 DnaJ domain-containing protein [Pyrinomonadaceae bacterium]MDW8303479.1 DnaJ domain-containing protein [Acidobacteriota bacterium]
MVLELLQASGRVSERPFAEVLAESCKLEFDGSFRLNQGQRQAVIYLRKGKVVFASSNERIHRLFVVLLEKGKLQKEQLVQIPAITNDFELAQSLLNKGLINELDLKEAFKLQIERILLNLLSWCDGEWLFTTLARAKENLNYEINLNEIFLAYARAESLERIRLSFSSFQEKFLAKLNQPEVNLLPKEAYVLSRFEDRQLTLEELFSICGLPEDEVLRIVYTLWLCGVLDREDGKPIFSQAQIQAIRSVRLKPSDHKVSEAIKLEEKKQKEEAEEALEEYLNRVEHAENFYQVLNVSTQSTDEEIKKAYFSLAKRFHPDRFHKEAGTQLHERIQKAFSQIARAYETLKDERSRQAYDLKIRNHMKSKTEARGESAAEEAFKEGYELMTKEKYVEALPFLARAVFLEPGNARYRAFYGKLLSLDERHKFKAEAELQEAIKLDPKNPDYRIMLAEFYLNYGLLRRAEGELRRILEAFPNEPRALKMLEELSQRK